MSHPNGSGTYYVPQPVDFLLLDKMPEEGMVGGIHWKGKQAKQLRQDLIDDGIDAELIPMTFIAARLRSMNVAGLVETYSQTRRSSGIWARKPKGTEQLSKREEVLGGFA